MPTAEPDRHGALYALVRWHEVQPIPANPWLANQVFHAQWVWVGPSAPPPCPPLGVSASNALEVKIQP